MNRSTRRAFTLLELMVVMIIIGILVSLLLPAIQSAREAARRASCTNHLVQLIIAVHNYESAYRVYPPGSIDARGPIQNVPQGYHHGWIVQLLPHFEMQGVYRHINHKVGVYHRSNARIRDLDFDILRCPSSPGPSGGYTNYAAVHHDVEAPIDVDNHGVFFLNSRVRYRDITDGASNTLFLGEKLSLAGDLGWMSGTRSTLRNTGTVLNATNRSARINGQAGGAASQSQGFMLVNTTEHESGNDGTSIGDPIEQAGGAPIVNGLTTTSTAVGGFESYHTIGCNFAFGDGNVRFLADTIDTQVYQQLGHRADGKLLQPDY
jgi:prepilin-type N-terminal cleavage/methylation domain-containing protein